jgi:pimeloyl-[acyl-carrier protein] synthase
MRAFAKPLPVTVICDLLQVPRDDFAQLEQWSAAIAEQFEMTAGDEQHDAANEAYRAFKEYMARFVAERRRAPGDGLIDRLIAAERETEALSSDELLANIILLLAAGHETTTNLIGNGVWALLEHPDQLALLRARPELGASAVEELLRYESPANANARCPSEDLEIGSKLIKKGQLVLCMLGAANRDPEVFADPDRLDITRDPNPHTSFGGGAHHCVGAHLARLEGRVALRMLLERYPELALDRERTRWSDRTNLRGFAELQLRVAR